MPRDFPTDCIIETWDIGMDDIARESNPGLHAVYHRPPDQCLPVPLDFVTLTRHYVIPFRHSIITHFTGDVGDDHLADGCLTSGLDSYVWPNAE